MTHCHLDRRHLLVDWLRCVLNVLSEIRKKERKKKTVSKFLELILFVVGGLVCVAGALVNIRIAIYFYRLSTVLFFFPH